MNIGRWENIIFTNSLHQMNNITLKDVQNFVDLCNNILILENVLTDDLAGKSKLNAENILNYFNQLSIDLNIESFVFNEELNNTIQELKKPELMDENKLKKILAYIIKNKTIEIKDNENISNIELPDNIDDIYTEFYNVLNDKERFLFNMCKLYIDYFGEVADFNYNKILDLLNDNLLNIINELSEGIVNDIINSLKERIYLDTEKHNLTISNIIDIILKWKNHDKLPEFNNIQKDFITSLKSGNNPILYNDFEYNNDDITPNELLAAIINTINTLNNQLNITFEKEDDLKNDIKLKIYNYFLNPDDKLKLFYKFISKYLTEYINIVSKK